MKAELPCSEQSCAVGEGLAGTAVANTDHWILLEYWGEWKPKAYEQAVLPESARAAIDRACAESSRVRVQLIRRAERRHGERLRLMLARSTRGHEQTWEVSIDGYEDVASIDLAAWVRGEEPLSDYQRTGALYLVCVHGKRDRCCALKGMPVYRHLCETSPLDTWQTTHLGGHRFAATLVCLPEGLCYGRVEPDEVTLLLQAHGRNELYDLSRYRGRTCDSEWIQAADMLLREQLGERVIGGLSPLAVHMESDQVVRVSFRDRNGRDHAVTVTLQALALIQPSCDVPERKPAIRFLRS